MTTKITSFRIEDKTHCDDHGTFESFQDAYDAIIGFTSIPWDKRPNRAPCRNWRNCGRYFQIVESRSWTCPESEKVKYEHVGTTEICKISCEGVLWIHDVCRSE